MTNMLQEPKYEPASVVDNLSAPEIANRVLSDLDTFVLRHSANGKPYIARYLIEYHFGCRRQEARDAKQLVLGNISDDELEDAAGE